MGGPIVEVCHGDGNFMHVRFRSAAAADACLAQNGRPILGKLLIGCVPCSSDLVGMTASSGSTGQDASMGAPSINAPLFGGVGAMPSVPGMAYGAPGALAPRVTR